MKARPRARFARRVVFEGAYAVGRPASAVARAEQPVARDDQSLGAGWSISLCFAGQSPFRRGHLASVLRASRHSLASLRSLRTSQITG